MAFRFTGRVLGALQKERNDVQPALRKIWKAYEHTDGLVRDAYDVHLGLFTENCRSIAVLGL